MKSFNPFKNPALPLTIPSTGCLLVPFILATTLLRAEQIEMKNGDRYNATVVSMNNESIVIQSDVLGTIKLTRGQVANISLGNAPAPTATATTQPQRPQVATGSPGPAASATNLSTAVRQLATETNLIQQVQNDYLTGADAATKAKFNEMLGGLAAGTMSVNDLRAQAKSAADQLRAMKKELGGGADDVLDGYLAVLDNFVKESATSETPATTAATPAPRAGAPGAAAK